MAGESPDKIILGGALEMLDQLKAKMDDLAARRDTELEARKRAKKAERDLTEARTMAVIEISAVLGPRPDPTTGRSNADYTEKLVANELLSHSRFQESLNAFVAAEGSWLNEQRLLNDAVDALATFRTASRLMTAILMFIADDQPNHATAAAGPGKADDRD